jgi:hypothetical protein
MLLSLAMTLQIIPFTETNSDLPKVSSEAAVVLPRVVGLVISGSRAKQVCSSLVVYIFFSNFHRIYSPAKTCGLIGWFVLYD